ncbi:TonB family protein [Emcibacter sp.]|uniref:TonB family protein n=1 Tax=Emcibacter sp. TaxID=1979954 RepID=UPI003A905E93
MKTAHFVWIGSGMLALAIHVMLLLTLTVHRPGAREMGVGGIDIGLGPAGRAMGLATGAGQDEQSAVHSAGQEAGEKVRRDMTKPEVVAEKDAKLFDGDKTAANDIEPLETEPAGSLSIPERVLVEGVGSSESSKIANAAKPVPKQTKKTEDRIGKALSPVKDDSRVSEKRKIVTESEEAATGEVLAVKSAARSVRRGEGGSSQSVRGTSAIGQGDDTRNGGQPGGDYQNYYSSLQQWIQRYQTYPSQARRLKQQGVVLVRLGIAAEGRLLFVRVHKSSGYPLLDVAALEAVRLAAPMPPLPEGIGRQVLTVILPMQYVLT